MHYRPQNGKAELSRLGIFSSFLCSLHFSSVCLCSSLKHCAQRAQTPCSWKPCNPLSPGGFGKSQAQAEAGIPVAAAAGAVSPTCPVLPIRHGGILRSQLLRGVPSLYPLSCSPAWGLSETRQVSGWPLRREEDGRMAGSAIRLFFILFSCQYHEPCRATGTKLSLPCTAMKS